MLCDGFIYSSGICSATTYNQWAMSEAKLPAWLHLNACLMRYLFSSICVSRLTKCLVSVELVKHAMDLICLGITLVFLLGVSVTSCYCCFCDGFHLPVNLSGISTWRECGCINYITICLHYNLSFYLPVSLCSGNFLSVDYVLILAPA